MPNLSPALMNKISVACDSMCKRLDSFMERKDGGQVSGTQGHTKGKKPIVSNHLDKGMKEREAKTAKTSFKL